MLKVDRKDYCPKRPYNDEAIDIGCNSTIPEPREHATALQFCFHNLRTGAKVLDVGCGSGYSTAVLYEQVKDPLKMNEVSVVGIDIEGELVELSRKNLSKNYKE